MEHIAAICSEEIFLIFNTFNQSTHQILFLLPIHSNYSHRHASGANIQILLFGVAFISLKDVASSAHTMCGIVRARWGKGAHITFLFLLSLSTPPCFCAMVL